MEKSNNTNNDDKEIVEDVVSSNTNSDDVEKVIVSEENDIDNAISAYETDEQIDSSNDILTDPYAETVGFEDNKGSELSPMKKMVASIYDIVEMFALCTAAILLIFTFAFRLTVVEGPSMQKTLFAGNYLIIQSIGYTPQRGDIVVIHDMSTGGYDIPLVKRVIAIGGDDIEIDFSTWTVKINGIAIDESEYRNLTTDNFRMADYDMKDSVFTTHVDDGCIFVMGDNRNHSADSRLSVIGEIDQRCVVGKSIYKLPFSKDVSAQ